MVFDTFKRRKQLQERGDKVDIYVYDYAPSHLRHQICTAFSEGIGSFYPISDHDFQPRRNANLLWSEIDRTCRKEIEQYLHQLGNSDLSERFYSFLMHIMDIEDFVSAVEIGCLALNRVNDPRYQPAMRGAQVPASEALDEINIRFRQHSVGYQFENGCLIRVDSQIAHAEIIKPALRLLTTPLFVKADAEFMTAHRHYRAGEHKACVVAANRSFESMLKAICDSMGWTYGQGDGASELITKVTSNGLFTHAFDRSFTAYVAMLKAGLPAIRNDAGGHGEGLAATAVTVQIARLALNLTASNILFLGESYEAMKLNRQPQA